MMLVPCRHLPAAEGCFRAADTPGTAEGPTRAPVGLCWRRQLASQKSTASQIPSSCLMLVVPWWGPWGSATPPWGRAGPGRPGHRHHLPLCGDTAGHKDPHCCDSSWARSDRDAWVLLTQQGAWLMEKPTVIIPIPSAPRAPTRPGSPHPMPEPWVPSPGLSLHRGPSGRLAAAPAAGGERRN